MRDHDNVKFFGGHKISKILLFKYSRWAFGTLIILFAIWLAIDENDANEGLQHYYNLWQKIDPHEYEGKNQYQMLKSFEAKSSFNFIRGLILLFMFISGGLIISNNEKGPALSIVWIAYFIFIEADPFLSFNEQIQLFGWEYSIKLAGVTAGLLFALTRGHTRRIDVYERPDLRRGIQQQRRQ